MCVRKSWNPLLTDLVAAADPSTSAFTGKIVATTLPYGILELWDWTNTENTAAMGGIADGTSYNPPTGGAASPTIGIGQWEAWRFLPSGEDDRWVLEATWETEISHNFYGIADVQTDYNGAARLRSGHLGAATNLLSTTVLIKGAASLAASAVVGAAVAALAF